jgi:DNA-binding transcriptional ArsR family regulator
MMQVISDPQRKLAAEDLIKAFDFKFFKTMSEPVRMQILKFLLLNGRSDIATIAENMPQDRSVISRHLNLMSEVGILRSKKETRHVYYEIDGTLFLDKLETIAHQIRECMPICCPNCLE